MTTTALDPRSRTAAPAAVLLAQVRVERAAADAAEARLLELAVGWALMHPAGDGDAAADWAPGMEVGLPIAGEGAPLVAEFCVAEFAAALSPDAAAYVDRHLAAVAHRVGPAQTQRLVEEAMLRLMPVEAAAAMERAWDSRHVTIHDQHLSGDGTMHVGAKLDIADALDLDAALADRAVALAGLGCDASLDVRRSLALGDLARTQLAFGFDQPAAAESSVPATRQVVLHVHLTEFARLEKATGSIPCAGGSAPRPGRPRPRPRTRNARRCDLDHITPYDRAGPTATDNLAPLCRRHHGLKTHGGWTYAMTVQGTYVWRSPHGLTYIRDHGGTVAVRPPDR